MIYMIYRVTTAFGKRAEYLREFDRIAEVVRAQKGCIEYDIYVDCIDLRFNNKNRNDIVIIAEKWESIEDLQSHAKSEVMNYFREAVMALKLNSEYELLTPYLSTDAL